MIPTYEDLMLPLLRLVAHSGDAGVRTRDAVQRLGDELKLSDEDRTELLPSGRQAVFANRVGWAATYLKKAKLIASPMRGVYRLSSRGADYLETGPATLTNDDLAEFEEFRAFKDRGTERNTEDTESGSPDSVPVADTRTPRERIEALAEAIERQLADELLDTVLEASPQFFERLVVDLLLAMGYGGTHREAGRALGQSHDGGVDGVINEDRLGLDRIYVQAKRWQRDRKVGRPDIQQFAGALAGVRAKKGVFLTTAEFASPARKYVESIDPRIILIDGDELARLMIEHEVGVSTVSTIALQRLDSDYFDEG